MTIVALLVVYSLLIVIASLAGGLVPLLVRLTHQRMQLALSFVAGAMLGVGLLHLIPHAMLELSSIDQVVAWALTGFLAMFFIERFFAFHHHDISESEAHALDAPSAQNHDHAHHHRITWTGAAIGMALHSLMDGIALAASVEAEAGASTALSVAGLGTFFVVFLHKPFDALTLGTLLAATHRSPRARHWVNVLFALLVPGGMMLFVSGIGARTDPSNALIGAALAFSGGTFLCIASSDLLPELQFHQHDRFKLSFALLLGIAAAWAIGQVEGSHHGRLDHAPHHHSAAPIGHRH